MSKSDDLGRIIDGGIVAVMRAQSGEKLVDVAEALLAGAPAASADYTVLWLSAVLDPYLCESKAMFFSSSQTQTHVYNRFFCFSASSLVGDVLGVVET